MGTLHVQAEATTPVPPKAARAWNFDLQANDHSDPRFGAIWGQPKPGDGRTILARTPVEVRVRDVFGGRAMEFTTRLVGEDALAVEGKGDGYTSKGTLVFKPEGQGSRVVQDIRMETRGLLSILMLLMGGKFKRNLEADMRLHQTLMEEAWRQRPW